MPDRMSARRTRQLEDSREFEETFGFGLPWNFPDYVPAAVGSWRLCAKPSTISESYLARNWVDPPHHALTKDGETWMSTSMLEIESHAWHLERARGTVLVAGIGMGMFIHAAIAKPEVERVVAIERDPEVVELLRVSAGFDRWAWRSKVSIVIGDALDPATATIAREFMPSGHPDYLYADIWDCFPHPDAAAETRAMCGNYDPVEAGWWGQEMQFGLWAEERGYPCSAKAISEFFADEGIPGMADARLASFCEAAVAANFSDGNDNGDGAMPFAQNLISTVDTPPMILKYSTGR